LAREYIEHWQALEVQDLTLDVLRAAIESVHRFKISYWDAAIIEAARMSGCDTVLSEDLNDGQSYGGVQVQNPFRRGMKPRT
jgi:predicted nucleic acid-binding protein